MVHCDTVIPRHHQLILFSVTIPNGSTFTCTGNKLLFIQIIFHLLSY